MTDLVLDVNNKITTNDELELILQQMDLLFDTDKYEVLGEPEYGTNYDQFLYELSISNTYIQQYIYNDILINVELFNWDVNVTVNLLAGTENDIMLVSIDLYKDNMSYQQNYKLK